MGRSCTLCAMASPQASIDLAAETVDLLLAVMRAMGSHFAERIAEFDLNPSLAMALRSLDTPTPQRELAGTLHCDPSHVTGIVDRLEERDLVERQVDPDDRRIKNVVVTDAGRKLRQQLEERLYDDPPVLRELSPAELKQLHGLLRKMSD